MKTTSRSEIATANSDQLEVLHHNLLVERMKLDKFFSIFLDQNEMDEEEPDTPAWTTYREMLKEYSRVEQLIKIAAYRIQHVH